MDRFIGLFLALLMPVTAVAANLTAMDEAILGAIDQRFDAQVAFLEKTVNQNSGTLNVAGVRAVGEMMKGPFEDLGFKTRWISMPAEMGRAGHFVATRRFGAGAIFATKRAALFLHDLLHAVQPHGPQ